MIGNILQSEKLLEKRGIDVKWQTFVAAGFSNEAFIPGRIQLASTGAFGVLALLANKVPTRALAVHSPGITHAATVPLDSPLKSLADLKDQKVLKRPAVVGTTTGSTNHFGFIAAAAYLGSRTTRTSRCAACRRRYRDGPQGRRCVHDLGAPCLRIRPKC
jgi:ABC-type nitrate/sulfonate/bicarbonate transport system substrate-binding protein